jgi:hypothetical protein
VFAAAKVSVDYVRTKRKPYFPERIHIRVAGNIEAAGVPDLRTLEPLDPEGIIASVRRRPAAQWWCTKPRVAVAIAGSAPGALALSIGVVS